MSIIHFYLLLITFIIPWAANHDTGLLIFSIQAFKLWSASGGVQKLGATASTAGSVSTEQQHGADIHTLVGERLDFWQCEYRT